MVGIDYVHMMNTIKDGRIRVMLSKEQLRNVLVDNGFDPKTYNKGKNLLDVMDFIGYKNHR
jgi:hypothetical protein